jgi:CBS domain containing-hemolysin-like protein
LGLGWTAEPFLIRLFEPILHLSHAGAHTQKIAHGALVTVTFLLITFLDVVIGEVAPKSLALHYTERLALATAIPMETFASFTRPFLRVIAGAAHWVLRPFGASASLVSERVHSAEELKLLISASLQLGQLAPFQEDIMQRVLDLHEVPVREIMTPRHEVIAVPAQTTFDAAVEFVSEHPRSRIPAYEDDLDHIVGLLYAKDLLRVGASGRSRPLPRSIRPLLRPLPVVPESKPVDQLLLEFQNGRSHFAAVVDEFGTLTGVVTVEDVLEQIVGEVQDEYDVAQPLTPLQADEPVQIDGLTSIRDLEAQYGVEFPRDDAYETLAGFLLLRLGHIPQGGEQVQLGDYRFTVLSLDGHRIAQVKLERAPVVVAPE